VALYSHVARVVGVTISGSALDQVTSAMVVDSRGVAIAGLSVVFTGSASASRRTLEVRGSARVPVGTYRLRIVTSALGGRSAQTLDLPPTLVQVEVGDGRGYSGHSYAITPLMTCAECHDLLMANVSKAFQWDAKPVVPADVALYGLATSALGATVSQIVRGERVARVDGQKCTACHNPATGGASVNLTPSTAREFMCQMVPIFVNKPSKPQGLKNFFQNWKERSCP